MGSKTKIYIVLEFVTGGELFDKIVSKWILLASFHFQLILEFLEEKEHMVTILTHLQTTNPV